MKVHAIIPAAGQGKRFGAAKQFQPLGGKPLFFHALQAFEDSPQISGICLVVPESEILSAQSLLKKSPFRKIQNIVSGGNQRQDSVMRGFEALPPCDLVIVHDGVRPFPTAGMIEKTVSEAMNFGGCIVGVPVKETIKKVDAALSVKETVDRTTLWSIQTPQAFRYEILQKALTKAKEDRFIGTDEAMLVERIGVKVRVIEGSPYNIKITTPEDLKIAEAILRRKERT